MSDPNSPADVLADSTGQTALLQQIAELQAQLAQYQGDKVVRPEFGGEVPKYKLNNPCYLEDDTLHEEGEEIEYLGPPNQDMVPLNDAARERMEKYLDHLTSCWREKAAMMGRPGAPLPDMATGIAIAMQDARRAPDRVQVVMPVEKGEVAAMPHLPEAQAAQRRRGRPPKSASVVSSKAPAPPPKIGPQPIPVLGRDYTTDSASGTRG